MLEVTPQDVAMFAPEFKAFASDLGGSTSESFETQIVSFSSTPDDGELELSLDSQSFTIAFDDDAETIEEAMQALPGFEEVIVTGGFEEGFTFDLSDLDNPQLLVIESNTLTDGGGDIEIEISHIEDYTDPASGNEITKRMIEVARGFVCVEKWEDKAITAIALMAAHLLTELGYGESGFSTGAIGPVTMEKVGDLQRSYGQLQLQGASTSEQLLATTKYGKMFITLRKTLLTTPMVT